MALHKGSQENLCYTNSSGEGVNCTEVTCPHQHASMEENSAGIRTVLTSILCQSMHDLT